MRFYPLVAPVRLGAVLLRNLMYLDHFDRNAEFWIECPMTRSRELDGLFEHYGSDKGAIGQGPFPYAGRPHTYGSLYESLFAGARLNVEAILEIGLGTNDVSLASNMGKSGRPGASLRAWRDYFPNATVFGGDVDKNILFTEERIVTAYLDQLDRMSIERFFGQVLRSPVDIIIDDGLHTFEAGVNTLECLWPALRPDGGFYIIEDVTGGALREFASYFNSTNLYEFASVSSVSLFAPNRELSDNSVVVLRKRVPPDERSIREVVR